MNRTLKGDVSYSGGELGISQCVWCRHRYADGRRCRAYPKGIPEAIAKNRHDHRYPFDQDFGVRFQPEVVEIEFVDVEEAPESVPLSTELVIAMARLGSSASPPEALDEAAPDEPGLEVGEGAFELDITALG
jgi:hypothetical protein